MDADPATILNRILMRETYSLLQYLHYAWPWTALEEQETLNQLSKLIAEEQKAARRLIDFLLKNRQPPLNGWFPQEFMELQYLALDHVLPRLVRNQRWAVGELEKDLGQLKDQEARGVVADILAMKRRHLAETERLAERHSGERAVSTLR